MAGKITRFGEKFKAFLKIGDQTFIERAVSSFDGVKEHIKDIIFVYLREQEEEYKVKENLERMFPNWNHRSVILEEPTKGPAETIRNAVQQDENVSGKTILCDCDHYLDVKPMFDHLVDNGSEECVILTWNLRGEDIKNWSVASVDERGYLEDITEKELPKIPGGFFGVIGCYYFNDVSSIFEEGKYVSHVIKNLLKLEKTIKAIQLHKAEFFGTPGRLKTLLDKRIVKPGTIFCDLDGTLVKHEDVPSYDVPLEVLPGTMEKLKEWEEKGHKVILSTSRKSQDKEKLVKALREKGLPYSDLVMDLPSGPRHLINDRKPSLMLTPNAVAFEIRRNQGIKNLNINPKELNIIKRFGGGSFSDTLLIEEEGKLFVRKVVSKQGDLGGYEKLKKQCTDLKRISKLCSELIPQILSEEESSFEYYYDLEFLPDYEKLSNRTNKEKLNAVKKLLEKLSNNLYNHRTYILDSGREWLLDYLSVKIYPKLKEEKLSPKLFSLVESEKVIINGKEYFGLSNLLEKVMGLENVPFLTPTYLCPIHGDLTFENIQYKDNHYNRLTNSYEPGIKLIDSDSMDFVDPPEMDLGKILQSVVSQYEFWSSQNTEIANFLSPREVSLDFQPIPELLEDIDKYLSMWSNVIEGSENHIKIKGYFHMAMHLIRMIPFRLKVNENQALYALATAIKYLTYVLESIESLKNRGINY